MSQKTFFGCMDFRNAKFQGSIRDNLMDGIGIVFDNEYTLSLTNWKNQMPYGPSLIIFPNRDYLYGKLKNKQLQDICSYVTSQGEIYYFNFTNGESENVAYIDNNSAIIELSSSQGKLHVVKTYVDEANSKWKIISDILKSQLKEDYRDCKRFVKATLLKEFSDILQYSENANLTFIGFKNSISLGVKFDKNNMIKQIGSFEEFPRNIEFGRKIAHISATEIRIQQGKFTRPEEVYVFKQGKKNVDAIKQTENYFKKGTNFKNQFVKLNVFTQLNKYFTIIKSELNKLKIFQFGQQILQNQYCEQGKKEQQTYINKKYDLSQVKKDIYTAANRRNNAKNTNRSITQRGQQIDGFQYRNKSPIKNSNEKYTQLKINNQQEAVPLQRNKQKYSYCNDTQPRSRSPLKQAEYALRYRELTPPVSDFDNIDNYYRQAQLADKNFIIQQRRAYLKREELSRENAKRFSIYDQGIVSSPISKLYQQSSRNQSRSPIPLPENKKETTKNQKSIFQQTESKYSNFIQYKNRKKMIQQQKNLTKQPSKQATQKYKIYQRKILGPNNVTLLQAAIQNDKPSDRVRAQSTYQQITLNPYKNQQRTLPGRYKKNYKYT